MKDEEMAEEWVKQEYPTLQITKVAQRYIKAFLAGLKAGRPQWHKVADGDLPEVDNRIVLCVCVNGYIDGKRNYTLKLLTRKEFPLFQPVYAWKEIVLPELPKEIV